MESGFDIKDEEAGFVLDLKREQADICDGKWMQSRYYCDEGDRVRDFLSFNSVFEINPFEVGVNRRSERKAYRVWFYEVVEALELTRLLPQNFLSLSNGEMRRVLFARALLKNPKRLTLLSPMAGLDIAYRKMFLRVVDRLRDQGVDISIVDDEEARRPSDAVKENLALQLTEGRGAGRKAVVEMRDVTLRFARRTLFENFRCREAHRAMA